MAGKASNSWKPITHDRHIHSTGLMDIKAERAVTHGLRANNYHAISYPLFGSLNKHYTEQQPLETIELYLFVKIAPLHADCLGGFAYISAKLLQLIGDKLPFKELPPLLEAFKGKQRF